MYFSYLGFQEKVSSLLCQIKEQNNQILVYLSQNQTTSATVPEFPVTFPLTCTEELKELEILLQNKTQCKALVKTYAYLFRIMKQVNMFPHILSCISWGS